MTNINQPIDDKTKQRKRNLQTTWIHLIKVGLETLEGKRGENAELSRFSKENEHLQRNIGKMNERLIKALTELENVKAEIEELKKPKELFKDASEINNIP